MNQLTPMMSSGMLTLLTFCVIAGFIILGSLSLRRHTKRIDPEIPWESEMTEEGRAAQAFERSNI
ncbi:MULTISPECIES: hypothetical protein [unclassified Luteococcus]|uniref:hypothetical protein n=1 Tax=unclassified Luteococcus TaxID=2639923 RepID=UPI00313E3846